MFVPLDDAHYPLLLNWLQLDHVKAWWDDDDDTIEKVRQHYSESPDTVSRFILMLPGETGELHPAGYFQYYLEEDGVRGIDQFLSDVDSLNKGLGTKVVAAFVQLVVDQCHPNSIIVDPEPDNLRAIACYRKVGFRHDESILKRSGKPAYIMRLLV